MDSSQQAVHDAFEELHTALTNAFFAASPGTEKDRLRHAADAVSEIVTSLNREDLKSRSADFASLKNDVVLVTKELTDLQASINGIVHDIEIATSVVQAIDKGLELGSKFFV